MIIVKLYTEEEEIQAECFDCDDSYGRSDFDSILYNADDSYDLPFRDAESQKLFKVLGNISFVSDDDWYSIMWDGERTCISALHKQLKFALLAIEGSRRGSYTWFTDADDRIWEILADLPFDILVAVRIAELIRYEGLLIEGTDYHILNYPLGDEKVDLTVKSKNISSDAFYKELPNRGYPGGYSTSYRVYLGEDGRYYTDNWGMRFNFKYHWTQDIDSIIEYIDEKQDDRIRIVDICLEYNIFEYAKALGNEKKYYVWSEYLYNLSWLTKLFEEGRISNHDEEVKRLQDEDSYQEYLYFRDRFKVISHVATAPKDPSFRKLPLLIVDKRNDGSYRINGGGLTDKSPDFCGLISLAIEERSREAERFMLVINSEELLYDVKDIDKAICGFRVTADSIEIFDIFDAVKLFGKMLKEAKASGKCKIIDLS